MDTQEIAALAAQIRDAEMRMNEIMREVMLGWAERMAQKGKRGWLAMDSDGAVWLFPSQPVVDDDFFSWAISAGEATHITDSVPSALAARTWRDSLTEVRS